MVKRRRLFVFYPSVLRVWTECGSSFKKPRLAERGFEEHIAYNLDYSMLTVLN